LALYFGLMALMAAVCVGFYRVVEWTAHALF
jgi:hypothetical protein